MVFQDPTGALNARQTIYEAVAEGLRIQGVRRRRGGARGRRALARGPAPARALLRRCYPYEVSGGQRQRVVIAGAMVLEPELLVADEPVSSLDASVRGEILALMLRLVARDRASRSSSSPTTSGWRGTSPIASRSCTSGGSSSRARPRSCSTAPRHPYTRGAALGRARGRAASSRRSSRGEAPDPTRIPPGCRFHPRCPLVGVRRGGAAGHRGALPRRRTWGWSRCPTRPDRHVAACHAVVGGRGAGARPRRCPIAATPTPRSSARSARGCSRPRGSTPGTAGWWPSRAPTSTCRAGDGARGGGGATARACCARWSTSAAIAAPRSSLVPGAARRFSVTTTRGRTGGRGTARGASRGEGLDGLARPARGGA